METREALDAGTFAPLPVRHVTIPKPDNDRQRMLGAARTRRNGPALCIIQHCALGSAVSPVLANLFLHYAFDAWMTREFPTISFERYIDDAVVHCVSQAQGRVRGQGHRKQDGGGRAGTAHEQDKDRVLQGWTQPGVPTSTPR